MQKLDPTHVRVTVDGATYYADTVQRTACYSGDLCKFTEAYWYDGSIAAQNKAAGLTARVLRVADRKLSQ